MYCIDLQDNIFITPNFGRPSFFSKTNFFVEVFKYLKIQYLHTKSSVYLYAHFLIIAY